MNRACAVVGDRWCWTSPPPEDNEVTLLDRMIRRRGVTAHWLAAQSTAVYDELGVAKSTIRNWQTGAVTSAQDWRSVAVLAQMLDLSLQEADRLMDSLGCMTISHRAKFALSPTEARVVEWWLSSTGTGDVAAPVGERPMRVPDLGYDDGHRRSHDVRTA